MGRVKYVRTKYPGVQRYVGPGRDRYALRFRDGDGRLCWRTFYGSLEAAARARSEILGEIPPKVAGLTGEYLDPFIAQEIVDWHSSEPCVYVAQRKIAPYIAKIGLSTWRGLRRRMADERLHLILAFAGDRHLERELHQRFDAYQCDLDGSEFFFLTKEIRAWIEERRTYVREAGVRSDAAGQSSAVETTA